LICPPHPHDAAALSSKILFSVSNGFSGNMWDALKRAGFWCLRRLGDGQTLTADARSGRVVKWTGDCFF